MGNIAKIYHHHFSPFAFPAKLTYNWDVNFENNNLQTQVIIWQDKTSSKK